MRKQRVVGSVVAAGVVLGSLVWGAAPPAVAASSPAEQILNLRTTPEDFEVRGMIAFNSKVYFVADDDKYGNELWETDGTKAGTKLVKDIRSGSDSGDPEDLTVVGSRLFFTADDGVNGRELWATDGTTTAIVKDIRTGSDGSYPQGLSNLNGTLVFNADDGTHGTEPWKSDGTAGGTALVEDIYPGPNGSMLDDKFAVVGSTAYVSARDEGYDLEVWAVTTSGADIVSDMTAGPDGSSPGGLTAVGTSVYFNVNGANYSSSIYRYDGTKLVRIKADYYPGKNFTEIDSDTIVFSAMDGFSYEELWVTDGTADSAVVLKNICAEAYRGSYPRNFVKMGTKVYFIADDCVNSAALWETDGTEAGTKMVKDIVTVGEEADDLSADIKHLTAVGSTLFFRANDRGSGSYDDDAVGAASVQYGDELWKSDGTTAGTVLVKDINTVIGYDGGPEGSSIEVGSQGPQTFPVLDGNIVFRACDGTTCGLWESDGTDAGTTLIANPNPVDRDSWPQFLGSSNNRAFFSARDDNGSGLFVTDGTAAGTTKLSTRYVEEGVVLNGKLIFGGADDSSGRELWISDGTPGGTVLLKDIYPGTGGDGPESSSPEDLTVAGPYVYFRAWSTEGLELWRTDGTADGTIMLTNVVSTNLRNGVDPKNLTAVGSQVYFQGTTDEAGGEPWKSNGTVEGTMMVKDINPGGGSTFGSYSWGFVKAGTTVFFSAYTPTTGREVWKTDGTSAGTTMVKDIRPGEQYPGEPFDAINSGNRESFVALGNKAYFSANDGSGGQQLWTSDGTAAGTYKVKQVSTYEYTSGPNPIIAFKNRLYFRVRESNNVERMWSSDGTEAGTAVFKDVSPNDYNWRSAGDLLYFMAYADGSEQIWQTDGTEAGTTKVTTDVQDIYSLLPFRGGLLFRANNGTNGREPWSVGLPVGTAQTISFTPPTNKKANETYALSATATSGLPVTFTAVGDCYIKTSGKNAGKLKLEGKGFCTVTASQVGDNTWARADDVQVGIEIARNSVTVAFVRVIPAITPKSVSPLANASGRVQLQAQVTPALEGCVVQFDVSPNNGVPAGPYLGTSDEDGVILSEPITLGSGTYDFTVTPLGDCEGTPVQAPRVYLGELPPTGANTVNLLAVAVAMLAAGAVIMVGARRRRHA